MVSIREVITPKDRKAFAEFPYRLYKNCPYWIPPIRASEYEMFDPARNPAFRHSEVKLWIAEKEGSIAGRVAGIINSRETQARGEPIGRFGWLEFEDDPAISRLLLETASQWAKSQGAATIKGPVGFSNLDPSGVTIEGFEELGTPFGAYNYPYYGKHLDDLRFEKLDDALEHVIEDVPRELPEKLRRLAPAIEKRYGIRQVVLHSNKEVREKAIDFFALLAASFKELHTYVPLSEEQNDWYINLFLPLVKPEYVGLLEDESGELVGFGLAIPSYSEALVQAKGRLYPFGFLHVLRAKRYHRSANLIMIGILEKWRDKGLNAILFSNFIPVLARQKVRKVFLNPQLESNLAPYAIFRDYNPRQFRKRRIYKKNL